MEKKKLVYAFDFSFSFGSGFWSFGVLENKPYVEPNFTSVRLI